MRRFFIPLLLLTCACESTAASPNGEGGGASSDGAGGAARAGGNAAGSGGSRSEGGSGGSAAEKGQPLFVAQGHLGRTSISCDQGKTWATEHRSLETYRWSPNPDEPSPTYHEVPVSAMSCGANQGLLLPKDFNCDHFAHPARGVLVGGGMTVTTFGWGEPGAIQTSVDGEVWKTVLQGTTFGGLAYVQQTWIAGGRNARRSVDQGVTWSDPSDTGLDSWNVRRVGQTDGFGGRAILLGDDSTAVVSSDGGKTWWKPDIYPSVCGGSIQTEGGVVSNADTWLIIGGDGIVCRSTDGGKVWTDASIGKGISSHVVWNGSVFQAWSKGEVHTSVDGQVWQSQAIEPADLTIGAVAADDNGHLAAVLGGWNTWDENQKFFHSDDGIKWQLASQFDKNDPIRTIAFGYGKKPKSCP